MRANPTREIVMDKISRILIGLIMIWMLLHTHLTHGRQTPVDRTLLRDVICEFETRHLANTPKLRARAVSHKQALGWCQIIPTTATLHNCRWDMLAIPAYNKWCALRILVACPGQSPYHLALCYNPSRRYAKNISVLYAIADRDRQWPKTIAMEE